MLVSSLHSNAWSQLVHTIDNITLRVILSMFTHNIYTVTVDQEIFMLNVCKLVVCKCNAYTVHG